MFMYLFTLRSGALEVTDHVESTFWQIITFTVHDLLERRDGILDIDELALNTREHLGNSERLAQETLQFSGSLDGQLVSF